MSYIALLAKNYANIRPCEPYQPARIHTKTPPRRARPRRRNISKPSIGASFSKG